MEIKKTSKADLENKKLLLRQIGLIITLAVVFLAFEYKSYDKRTLDLMERNVEDIPEEIVPITEQKVKPPPPPPPKQVTVLQVVEDDVEVEEEIEIDAEVDQETVIEVYVPPVREEEVIEEAEILQWLSPCLNFPADQQK